MAWTTDQTVKRHGVNTSFTRLAGSTDDDLTAAGFVQVDKVVPKLVLIHTVMKVARVPSVLYAESTGNCTGMHFCDALWPN